MQGNVGYALSASTDYSPGSGNGPSAGMPPITTILVTEGTSRVLDYYDGAGNHLTITLGNVTSPIILNLTLTKTGSSLTSDAFYGFVQ